MSAPLEIFCCYAREDQEMLAHLKKHLAPLERQGQITIWSDTNLNAGVEWEKELHQHLESADIILLLISPDFMASDYCYEVEMQRALERQRSGTTRVIPILLRPCSWQTAPIGHLQALPRNGRPIVTWDNLDEAFLEIEQSVHTLLTQPILTGSSKGISTRNRANMLLRLQQMYDEALEDNLQKLAWIDVPLTRESGAVLSATNLLLRRASQPAEPLASGTTVQQVYQQANQELLILGAPGAGKSTLLYHLGRNLLVQAQHSTSPLPVVFPLSSWSQKRSPLHEWLVEQLCSPLYQIPRRQSQQWVEQQQILPLLDGLDEMDEEARPACIEAINAYRRAAPLCPLVVCSRSQEYYSAVSSTRLHLQSAIEVQPLSVTQQEAALQQAGAFADELRDELATNEGLRELTRTPIWLNILLLISKEKPLPSLPQERVALQQEVLRYYIQRMCERKGNSTRYPQEPTTRWLAFLARQMRMHNQTEFESELIQINWLEQPFRRRYQRSVGPIFGLIFGLIFALIGGLFIGLGIELRSGLIFGLFGGLSSGLIFGLIIGLSVALRVGLNIRQGKRVTLAEKIHWSWKKAVSGLIGGLLVGLLLGLLVGLLVGLTTNLGIGLLVGLTADLLLGLVAGLSVGLISQQEIDRHTLSPGESSSRSLRNGLLFGLFGGMLIGLLGTLLFGLLGGLNVGLSLGLFIWLLVWLTTALSAGLEAFFQHICLRFWLWRANNFPFRLIPFLEDACARHLLKRVGGTYQFMHRLLLDYFADLFWGTTPGAGAPTHPVAQSKTSGDNHA